MMLPLSRNYLSSKFVPWLCSFMCKFIGSMVGGLVFIPHPTCSNTDTINDIGTSVIAWRKYVT